MYDITVKHPAYVDFAPSWRLMRDCYAGEEDIKRAGTIYLPMKTGQMAIEDEKRRGAVYDLYRLRAEFPEILAPTIRGAVGVMLAKASDVQLPAAMDHLRERATLDGLTLDALHRRIGAEVMTTGRYGLLPGLSDDGTPHLSGYTAESIINWDATNGVPDYAVLDETEMVRDRLTGAWETKAKYRECFVENGAYGSRVWTETASGFLPDEPVFARTPKQGALDALPFVFIGANDLTPAPDDVPLYGLAKLAIRVYRLDADFSFSLHMTSEPTPVAIGFDDPAQAVQDGIAPKTLGSSVLWILPSGGDAKYLEFSGPGLEKQAAAIKDALERAAQFGAQVIQDGSQAESGEALKLRAASQTATLTTIAQTTASGLEKALRHIAAWTGQNPDEVIVTPNLDFFDKTMTPEDITAAVAAWQAGAYSWRTLFDKLKVGGVIPEDRALEDEEADMAGGSVDDLAALLPGQAGAS